MTGSSYRISSLLALVVLLAAGAAQANPDYDAAVTRTKTLTDGLNSYQLTGTMNTVTNVKGQSGGREIHSDVFAAARFPDRLVSRQQGSGLNLNLGVGPEHSWFYLGQSNVCYLSGPVNLNREPAGNQDMGLEPEQIFDFYAGLGQTLLPADLDVMPETGHEEIKVGDRTIACQVFKTPGVPAEGKGPREYWFDPESGLVLKAVMTVTGRRNGVLMEQTLTYKTTGFSLNEPVDEDNFKFTVPADVKVVDQLEKLVNPDSMAGEAAPDISFTDLEGNRLDLSDFRGKVVFLDFWATWCGPCKMEMPHLQTLHDELGGTGEVVFLAASSEDQATIKSFIKKYGYTFKVVQVAAQDAAGKYGATSIPAGFVIDRQGVIKAHMVGAQSEDQLRRALARAGVGR